MTLTVRGSSLFSVLHSNWARRTNHEMPTSRFPYILHCNAPWHYKGCDGLTYLLCLVMHYYRLQPNSKTSLTVLPECRLGNGEW